MNTASSGTTSDTLLDAHLDNFDLAVKLISNFCAAAGLYKGAHSTHDNLTIFPIRGRKRKR